MAKNLKRNNLYFGLLYIFKINESKIIEYKGYWGLLYDLESI
jgi:hypothetical protein